MRNLLVEKEHACLKWYHRQLLETAQERYAEVKRTCHLILGRYFCNQSLTMNDPPRVIWAGDSHINTRRVKEAYYHLLAAEQWKEMIEEMCSLEMVYASIVTKDAFAFLSSLSRIDQTKSILPLSEELQLRAKDYYRWLRREISSIIKNGRMFIPSSASAEASSSFVYQDYERLTMELKDFGLLEELAWVKTLGPSQSSSQTSLLANLVGYYQFIKTVAWSPREDLIASGSGDSIISIWEVATGEVIQTLSEHSKAVVSLAWSRDGNRLLSGSWDETVRMWDILTGEQLLKVAGSEGIINSVAWNRDDSQFASGSNGVFLWDSNTGELIRSFHFQAKSVDVLAWNPLDNRQLAVGYENGLILVWDAVIGEIFCQIEGHSRPVVSISWEPKSEKGIYRLISSSYDGTVRLWAVSIPKGKGATGTALFERKFEKGSVYSLAWSPRGGKVALGYLLKGNIDILEVATDEIIQSLPGHSSAVLSLSWSPDASQLVSGSSDRIIKLWAIAEKQKSLKEDKRCEVYALVWSHTGNTIATGSEDTMVRLWDSQTAQVFQTWKHSSHVTCLAWSPDDRWIASGARECGIHIWEVATGNLLYFWMEESFDALRMVLFSPGESRYLISAYNSSTIRLWELASQSLLVELETGHDSVTCLTWSEENHHHLLVGYENKTIRIWDLHPERALDARMLQTISLEEKILAISSSGSHVITRDNESLILTIRELSTGKALQALRGHNSRVVWVSWSRRDDLIASGSADRTIKIWETLTGRLRLTLEGHIHGVALISWSPDHRQLVSYSSGDQLKLWQLPNLIL